MTTSPSVLLIIISLTGLIPVLGLSVQQTPEIINACEGANVSIKCHIQADSKVDRIIVLWLKTNLTVSEAYNISMHQTYNGNERFIATFHLHLIQLHHTGVYYCKVWRDLPTLKIVYGKGTHVYIAASTTPDPPLTISSSANSSEDTMIMASLSILGILLSCVAFVFHIRKRHFRSDFRAKDAIVDGIVGSQYPVTYETSVVYYTAFQK